MAQKTETVNVRVPEEIAVWIDSLVEKKLFSSRSEVVRHFMREYVLEQKRNSQNTNSNVTEKLDVQNSRTQINKKNSVQQAKGDSK